jgi:hypothetical protein
MSEWPHFSKVMTFDQHLSLEYRLISHAEFWVRSGRQLLPRIRHSNSRSTHSNLNGRPNVEIPTQSERPRGQMMKENYWDRRFSLSTIVLALLALLAAYLQYSVYPSIMANQFGETNVTIHLSFFTYTLDAQRCLGFSSCAQITGLPSFDFAQLFIALLILMQIFHFVKLRNH